MGSPRLNKISTNNELTGAHVLENSWIQTYNIIKKNSQTTEKHKNVAPSKRLTSSEFITLLATIARSI